MMSKGKSRSRRTNKGTSRSTITSKSEGREWLPGWAPYVVFVVLALFLFREFLVSDGLLFGTDVMTLGYFARHWYAEMVTVAGTFPRWNPLIFGGLPFVDAMHGDIFYPTTVLKFIMPVHRAMGWKIVLHVFLAGTVTYGWLRHLKVSRPIAMWGGAAYMLAPVLVSLTYAGHDGKLFVTALTPLALWATDAAITRGGIKRFSALALVVALLIFTAHMMLAYFVTWAIVVLAVYRLVQMRRAGTPAPSLAARFGAFALAGIIGGLAIGAVQIWTPIRYLTQYSQRVEKTTEAEEARGYAYSTSWSLHPEEAFSLVVPEFVGRNPQLGEGPATYWGRNLFKLNHEYGGLIPLLLLPLAFVGRRRRRGEAWLFTGIAAASLLYALGATTPFFHLYYWLVPGVKLFRAPSSIMFVFAIAVITAAAIGLEEARQSEAEKDWSETSRKVTRYLWIATGVFALLALLAATGVLTDLWVSLIYRDIAPDKAAALQENLPYIQLGLWLSVLLAGVLAGAWQLRARGSISDAAFIVALVALSFFDLIRVDSQFIQVINPNLIYPRDDTTEFLIRQQASGEPFRVLRLPNTRYGPNQFAFYGIEQVAGHHGNELGRYRDLTDGERLFNWRILQLLNVRYVVSGGPIEAPGLQEAFRGQSAVVYQLAGSYPRAFLVSRNEAVADSLALSRLLSPDFDPAAELIVDESVEIDSYPDAAGGVRWVERGINEQVLEVETSGPAYLVVSENYYPDWKAEVDGAPAPVLRADYSLRAVELTAGTHQVRFVYRSTMLRAAAWTTILSTLAVAGIIGASLFLDRRRVALADGEEAGSPA